MKADKKLLTMAYGCIIFGAAGVIFMLVKNKLKGEENV